MLTTAAARPAHTWTRRRRLSRRRAFVAPRLGVNRLATPGGQGQTFLARLLFRRGRFMKRSLFCLLAVLITGGAARAEELPARYREVVRKGLEYLAKQQHRDGHWEGNGGHYPTSMTALSGMAM